MSEFLTVLLLTAGLDAAWIYYFLYSVRKKPAVSAAFSGIIALMTANVTISYTQSPNLKYAYVLGALIGTYLAVRFSPLDKSTS